MINIYKVSFCLFFSCFFIACKNTEVKDQPLIAAADITLVANAYQNNLYTQKIAEEAITRSTSVETRNLATEIIAGKRKIKDELDKLAGSKGFALPLDITSTQLNNWQRLVRNKGWDFDKEFVEEVLRTTSAEKDLLRRVVIEASDVAIKNTAKDLLDSAEDYLQTVTEIQQTIEERTMPDSLTQNISLN